MERRDTLQVGRTFSLSIGWDADEVSGNMKLFLAGVRVSLGWRACPVLASVKHGGGQNVASRLPTGDTADCQSALHA